jgi:hypothetical protein
LHELVPDPGLKLGMTIKFSYLHGRVFLFFHYFLKKCLTYFVRTKLGQYDAKNNLGGS